MDNGILGKGRSGFFLIPELATSFCLLRSCPGPT